MPIENELSAVEQVYALEGLPLPEDLTPEPEPAVVTEPVDEVEALKAGVMAFGDPELIARFEKLMSDAETILQRKAEQDTLMRTLIAGSEIYFVDAFPDQALALFNAMTPDEQAALRETLRVQYALATSTPVHPSGDAAMTPNPMAVNPPEFGGKE